MELKDFVVIKSGKRLPKGTILTSIETKHPYIKVKDMKPNVIQLNNQFEYVPDSVFAKIKKYIVEAGDLILSIVGTIGNLSIIGKSLNKASLTENCVKLICSKGLMRNYLFYFLLSKKGQDQIKNGIVGSTQPKLPIYNIKRIKIDVPQKSIQQHIVGANRICYASQRNLNY